MKKILFIAKMNDLTKDIIGYLSRYFSVQYAAESGRSAISILDITPPDMVVMLLVGAMDFSDELFEALTQRHRNIPVLTIGTYSEQDRFSKYYGGWQFTNILRPCDNPDILDACCLRLGIESAAVIANSIKSQESVSPEGTMVRPTVLVVDDNAQLLRTMKAMLEHRYDVMVAPSGIKAMTMMGRRKPDVILLDYEMPVVDGRQTLEMIRAEDDLKDIPVIFLTGVDDKQHILAVLALEPAGYMLKPPVQQKIIENIDKILDGKK
ncbi:MAG: response regulator [Lachnospiraceae bacterium]|nr:response regulator [Lachnospiraceae bacterium]